MWQDAVTVAADYRAQAGVTDPEAALGPRPTDPKICAAWQEGCCRLENTRQWLATHRDFSLGQLHARPSRRGLIERRAELGQLLAVVPTDQRTTIDQLLNGQQAFDDVRADLETTQAQQRNRQLWILQHWPHVVEAAEIDRTLAFGPNLGRAQAADNQLSRA